jgi:hypothetical protein
MGMGWFEFQVFKALPFKVRVGVGMGLSLTQSTQNDRQYPLHVLEHVVVPEAQHDKSGLFEKLGAFPIIRNRIRMLPAIKFDNGFFLQANKIQYEIAKQMLAAELAVPDLAVPKALPKF